MITLDKWLLVMLGGSLGAASRYAVSLLTPDVRLLLITGDLGALTTFSTLSLETVNAGRAGLTLQSLTNILINNLGGLSLTWLGLRLGGLR